MWSGYAIQYFFLIIFFLKRYFCNKDSSFGTFIESKPFILISQVVSASSVKTGLFEK